MYKCVQNILGPREPRLYTCLRNQYNTINYINVYKLSHTTSPLHRVQELSKRSGGFTVRPLLVLTVSISFAGGEVLGAEQTLSD